jgi:hypothetical protein
MATVVIKNVSAQPVYLRDLSDTIEAGETVTIERFIGELTGMKGLNEAITAGTIQLMSTVIPASESYWIIAAGGGGGGGTPPSYSNLTRPAASTEDAGFMIWNTDDNAPNFSDGTNWRDAFGNLT